MPFLYYFGEMPIKFLILALLFPVLTASQENPALIRSSTAMETAWDFPKNPLNDSLPADSHLAAQIRTGFLLFTETPRKAARFTRNLLSCNNCHLNGGQREKAMPLVGISSAFPEYNKRSGRLISLEDRIVGCFLRSENATGTRPAPPDRELIPSPTSQEVLALSAYISWISRGFTVGSPLDWRGQNVIPAKNLVPLERLDRRKGKELFLEKCSTCHGEDGQGVEIGDKKAGPLWGPMSWNDGAGAARVYTLAGIIRFAMPYLDPGSLTDEEAQHLAAFINSKPRPKFPFKSSDYPREKVPVDAVYYKK